MGSPKAKMKAYTIRQRDDANTCNITGMVITNDRKILMADNGNSKVKMFSHDMKFLSSVSVTDRLRDIAMTSEREAVVTIDNRSLITLGIYGSQLYIKGRIELLYDVHGIYGSSRYDNTLIITSPDSKPPSVKKIAARTKWIDEYNTSIYTGTVFWSVPNAQGQLQFMRPLHVNIPDRRPSTVIVSDWHNDTLTMLNYDTGEVITRRELKGKGPRSVTTDYYGKVYVCCWDTSEMAVLSGDLSEEKILMSAQTDGLNDNPQAITYDETNHGLIMSYYSDDKVHWYQLSIPTSLLSKMKATKQSTYNIKQRDDPRFCLITSMAITNDRRVLMGDSSNSKVKLFSYDMKFLCSVSISDQPCDIAVISDSEAVVATGDKPLVILDISDRQLSIKATTQLSYSIRGISKYNDKLVVTSPDISPPSVKLIDQTGRVYWSVSLDEKEQPVLSLPVYVSSPGDGRSSTVIVSDWDNHTLTVLNGDTGENISKRQLEHSMCPEGVSTDSSGNVYVCYSWTSEVAVLSADLSEEKILLSTQDGLGYQPQAILYDDMTDQLFISYYYDTNTVDRFQLS